MCHFRKRGAGIDLASERFVVATQYADDVLEVLLLNE
jgi:hypothetical protein